ncbi:MAG: chemotaxis response regulator protein-glutamate methylesterase [Nitrospirae bacterium]|nr:chemotaxis response regulator protein-glutamate methylesterase [Nitrospirota bacterium]
MTRKIRVLVVDDSAFMRKALTRMLSSDYMIEVVDTASDGEEGYRKVRSLLPDVVTLDVKMPGMDGLTALGKIMRDCPVPVLMLSSLTSEGGEVTLRALDLGAVDFIDKSSATTAMDILSIAGDLITKVKAAAGVDAEKMARSAAATKRPPAPPREPEPVQPAEAVPAGRAAPRPMPGRGVYELVAIGTSTGGPPALQTILTGIPAGLAACVLVVQHMPIGFTASLAQRLDTLCDLSVSEAVDGDRAAPGRCLIAPSGMHMTVVRDADGLYVRLSSEPEGTLHRPSVDVLFESVAKVVRARALALILTGMGHDGARGIKLIRDAGGRTVAQDEASCVVYGMPKVAVEMGGVDRSMPLDSMTAYIIDEVGSC